MIAPAPPPADDATREGARWVVKCGKCSVEQHANGTIPAACPVCGAVYPAWPKPSDNPPPADGGDEASQAAWHAGIDVGVARGRAAALREVDEACEAVTRTDQYQTALIDHRDDGWCFYRAHEPGVFATTPTPTAAILAAAAALTPADADAEGGEASA